MELMMKLKWESDGDYHYAKGEHGEYKISYRPNMLGVDFSVSAKRDADNVYWGTLAHTLDEAKTCCQIQESKEAAKAKRSRR